MSNTTTTPNMNLVKPTVGEDPGPDWATNLNADLDAIDSHNHSTGKGVPIPPGGININTDLPFNDNNATALRSANFTSQSAPLATAADIGCVYVSGKDLYYNDEDGNQIRITQGGSVAGSSGTITGLPSGTASASFAGSTFTFQSATNTPANMSVGPLIIGANTASPKTVTLGPNVSQVANYAMTLPLALPGSTSIANCDSSGQQGFNAPDNTTFGIQASKYGVLDGGIGTTQLANSSVTNAKLGSVNYGNASTGSSVAITNTSFTAVTGLSVDITCIGRPVMIVLTSQLNGSSGYIQSPGSGETGFLRILRNGSDLQETQISISDSGKVIPSWVMIDLSPPAGSNTYALQARVSGATLVFSYCDLFVMEL